MECGKNFQKFEFTARGFDFFPYSLMISAPVKISLESN